jgi:hypothetical protein
MIHTTTTTTTRLLHRHVVPSMWGATHDSEDFVLLLPVHVHRRPAKSGGSPGRLREYQMPSTNPSSSVIVDQLTRALGEAVIRIWSNLPQEVQDHLFKEAIASQGDSIRSQLAVFLHGKHSRTSDPLGDPREMKEPDSLGG